MILFKKQKITVDCFVSNNNIAELFPIRPLNELLPAWWKSMPKEVPAGGMPIGISTIKRCSGFKDLFKNSFCLPSWSEYLLFQDPVNGFNHMSPNSSAGGMTHQQSQMEGAFNNYQHYKLISPWLLQEKSGINFTMTQASWHIDAPCEFHIPVGSLEFKYQHSTHINIVAPRPYGLKQHSIKAGQPLVYLVPMTEKEVNVKIQVVDDNELSKLRTYHHSFHNGYELTKKILKEKS
jgi:hypothetical protein